MKTLAMVLRSLNFAAFFLSLLACHASLILLAQSVEGTQLFSDVWAADYFILYGHVSLELQNWNNNFCAMELSVEIGGHVWKQQLHADFYSFQLPLYNFMEMVGLVSLDVVRDRRLIKNLWRRFFIVNDLGAIQMDIAIQEALISKCSTPYDKKGHALMRKIDAYNSHFLPSLKVCTYKRWHIQTCSVDNPSAYGQPTNKSLQFLNSKSQEPRENQGHKICMNSSNHLVFGKKGLQNWHLVFMLLTFLSFQFLIQLLDSFLLVESEAAQLHFNPDAEIAPWQFQVRDTKEHLKSKKKFDTLASGVACYEEAWKEADYHICQALKCASEEACFYYNCCSAGACLERQEVQGGSWNRDKFGRLIRHA